VPQKRGELILKSITHLVRRLKNLITLFNRRF